MMAEQSSPFYSGLVRFPWIEGFIPGETCSSNIRDSGLLLMQMTVSGHLPLGFGFDFENPPNLLP